MKLVAAYHAMAGPPRPLQYVLLVAEPGPDESGPAYYEVVTPPGYEEWRHIAQGRVRELAPNARTLGDIVGAISYNNMLAWGEVREFEVVADAIAEAYRLVGKEPGRAVVGAAEPSTKWAGIPLRHPW